MKTAGKGIPSSKLDDFNMRQRVPDHPTLQPFPDATGNFDRDLCRRMLLGAAWPGAWRKSF
jgi:hypothetical protein